MTVPSLDTAVVRCMCRWVPLLLVVLTTSWCIPAALAQSSVAAPSSPVVPVATDRPVSIEPEAFYAARTNADRSGRVHASVLVNGQGPFRFIVDTGANRSALAPSTVERLGLRTADVEEIMVHGVTGVASMPAVRAESLTAGALQLSATVLPVLSGDVFGSADGILGMAGVANVRLDIDFVNDRVMIVPSTGRRAPDGFLVIKARLWQGGLLLVDGRVGRVPTKIILDTGAEKTIGNDVLLKALEGAHEWSNEFGTTVHGATPAIGSGIYFLAPKISIGPASLLELPVTFGDLHVFKLWSLQDVPAMVVGMDVLGRLEHFIVDYKRREFQLKGIGTQGALIRRCTPGTCGSRIPENRG